MNVSVDEIDQLTDRLGDANDLAILRAKILNEPYDPSETQESAEIRRIFLQMLDRRKQKLQSEAFKLAQLVYAEKPGQFERRLATYWRVGQGSLEVSKTTYSGHDQEGRTKAHRPESENRNFGIHTFITAAFGNLKIMNSCRLLRSAVASIVDSEPKNPHISPTPS